MILWSEVPTFLLSNVKVPLDESELLQAKGYMYNTKDLVYSVTEIVISCMNRRPVLSLRIMLTRNHVATYMYTFITIYRFVYFIIYLSYFGHSL